MDDHILNLNVFNNKILILEFNHKNNLKDQKKDF